MTPPSSSSIVEVSKSETGCRDGLRRQHEKGPTSVAEFGLGPSCQSFSVADKFKQLSLKPTSNTECKNINEVGRLEEPMYFQIEDLKLSDLEDFAKHSTAFTEKSFVKRVSAVERRKKNGKLVHINKKEIAVFRYGEMVFAIDEKCPHAGGPLHLGDIESIGQANILCIVCPWHKWKIELKTGKLKVPQRQRETHVYPVKVSANGNLSIGFHEFSPDYFLCTEDF